MTSDPRLRSGLIVLALGLTLAAVYWASRLEEDGTADVAGPSAADSSAPARARPSAAAPPTGTERGPSIDLARLQRAPAAQPSAELFGEAPAAIVPPPRKALRQAQEAAEAPPPPPAPPPLPFKYLGQLAEAGRTLVFLAAGDRNLVVGTGDVIDGLYRIDAIGTDALMLTYLPMNVQQTLPTGAAQ
jgi:hypothetical protein